MTVRSAPPSALAARTGMRELAARAYLHRGRSGDGSALDAAQMLAAGTENPALAALLPPAPFELPLAR